MQILLRCTEKRCIRTHLQNCMADKAVCPLKALETRESPKSF